MGEAVGIAKNGDKAPDPKMDTIAFFQSSRKVVKEDVLYVF